MDVVRESSAVLMSRWVQTLLDEGVTAETFDLDSMPFAEREMSGHGLGKRECPPRLRVRYLSSIWLRLNSTNEIGRIESPIRRFTVLASQATQLA